MTRISIGELDMPDKATARIRLQHAFLCEVARLAPAVWVDLHESTQATYRELKDHYPADYLHHDVEFLCTPPESRAQASKVFSDYPALTKLIEQLDAWAEKWNLTPADPDDAWLSRVAIRQIEFWHEHGRAGEYIGLGLGAIGPIPQAIKPPSGLPGYNPLLQSRAEYQAQVRQQATAEISENDLLNRARRPTRRSYVESIINSTDDYCDHVESSLESAGFPRGEQKRQAMRHIEWAVKATVLGETQTAISRDAQLSGDDVSPQAVSKAIDQVLKAIGLR